jgi:ketosteroid isomerase-like protein
VLFPAVSLAQEQLAQGQGTRASLTSSFTGHYEGAFWQRSHESDFRQWNALEGGAKLTFARSSRFGLAIFVGKEESGVRSALQRFSDTYSRHDIRVADGLYAADAQVYGPSATMLSWQEYRKVWGAFFDEFPKAILTLDNNLQVRLLGKDAAVANGAWHEEYWDKRGKHYEMSGRITFVLQKTDGIWQIVHQHTSVPIHYQ